tara:strand:+ start:266 stop:805 length:540 start_codon:yes stop_codon:yes gene_type:complete
MNVQHKTVFNEINKLEFKIQARHNVTADHKGNNRGIVVGYIKNREYYIQQFGYPKYAISRTSKTIKYNNLFYEAFMMGLCEIPDFFFTSIQINKNHKCCKHIDSFNIGVSYIIGLGDYTGGELRVYNKKNDSYEDIDIRNKWYCFNGSKKYHETLPFTGERYSLVYYKLFNDGDVKMEI